MNESALDILLLSKSACRRLVTVQTLSASTTVYRGGSTLLEATRDRVVRSARNPNRDATIESVRPDPFRRLVTAHVSAHGKRHLDGTWLYARLCCSMFLHLHRHSTAVSSSSIGQTAFAGDLDLLKVWIEDFNTVLPQLPFGGLVGKCDVSDTWPALARTALELEPFGAGDAEQDHMSKLLISALREVVTPRGCFPQRIRLVTDYGRVPATAFPPHADDVPMRDRIADERLVASGRYRFLRSQVLPGVVIPRMLPSEFSLESAPSRRGDNNNTVIQRKNGRVLVLTECLTFDTHGHIITHLCRKHSITFVCSQRTFDAELKLFLFAHGIWFLERLSIHHVDAVAGALGATPIAAEITAPFVSKFVSAFPFSSLRPGAANDTLHNTLLEEAYNDVGLSAPRPVVQGSQSAGDHARARAELLRKLNNDDESKRPNITHDDSSNSPVKRTSQTIGEKKDGEGNVTDAEEKDRPPITPEGLFKERAKGPQYSATFIQAIEELWQLPKSLGRAAVIECLELNNKEAIHIAPAEKRTNQPPSGPGKEGEVAQQERNAQQLPDVITVVLTVPNPSSASAVEKAFDRALNIVAKTLSDPRVLPAGGAYELALLAYIQHRQRLSLASGGKSSKLSKLRPTPHNEDMAARETCPKTKRQKREAQLAYIQHRQRLSLASGGKSSKLSKLRPTPHHENIDAGETRPKTKRRKDEALVTSLLASTTKPLNGTVLDAFSFALRTYVKDMSMKGLSSPLGGQTSVALSDAELQESLTAAEDAWLRGPRGLWLRQVTAACRSLRFETERQHRLSTNDSHADNVNSTIETESLMTPLDRAFKRWSTSRYFHPVLHGCLACPETTAERRRADPAVRAWLSTPVPTATLDFVPAFSHGKVFSYEHSFQSVQRPMHKVKRVVTFDCPTNTSDLTQGAKMNIPEPNTDETFDDDIEVSATVAAATPAAALFGTSSVQAAELQEHTVREAVSASSILPLRHVTATSGQTTIVQGPATALRGHRGLPLSVVALPGPSQVVTPCLFTTATCVDSDDSGQSDESLLPSSSAPAGSSAQTKPKMGLLARIVADVAAEQRAAVEAKAKLPRKDQPIVEPFAPRAEAVVGSIELLQSILSLRTVDVSDGRGTERHDDPHMSHDIQSVFTPM